MRSRFPARSIPLAGILLTDNDMAKLTLLQGPAGGGKSELAADMLEAGEADVVADVTQLWAATGGYQRGPDGRYPVRDENDPALHTARVLQATAASFGLAEGYKVAVTTSRRDQVERWSNEAARHDAAFDVRTVDPGEDVVRARLADPVTGDLSDECEGAIGRWFKK